MRYIKAWIAAALTLNCAACWAETTAMVRVPEVIPTNRVITLPDAIALALRNQPAVRQAQAQVEIETGLVTQSRSRLLPSTTVTTLTNIAATPNNNGTALNLSENQLVYDFGRSRELLTQSERLRAAAIYALTAATSDATFNVKSAYYNLLQTTRLVAVFKQNLADQEAHVAQAQARFAAGLAPRSDVLNAQASAASARVNLVNATNNMEQSRVNLNVAMGIDVRSDTHITDTTEPAFPVPTLDQAISLAIGNRPEMHQVEDQVLAALAALRSAETGNLPAFSTSIGTTQVIGNQFVTSSSLAWLLNLQWTPFDAGFTQGAVTQARGQLVSTEEALFSERQIVSSDVTTARFNIIANEEALAAAKVEVASATENLAAATGRYEAGVAIFIEVTDAQALLLKAQVDEAVAIYGLSTARAQLEHAVGVTSPEGIFK